MIILAVVGIILAASVLWVVCDLVKGILTKDAPRRPVQSGDDTDYDYSMLQCAVWLIEHPGRECKTVSYTPAKDNEDSLFAWKEKSVTLTGDMLTEASLIDCIRPASAYMAKRYDCSDFRAIWLCKLRYALDGSDNCRDLLTEKVDDAVKAALAGFKYWITSDGTDSMCYYSENHQMVFAVSEYLAGAAYPDEVFSIDGKSGREHMSIAAARMNNWFDQRARYGFSEFLSSNYLAVDIGALSVLLMYCRDSKMCSKAETALNLILLDYSLQMYDSGFSGPAGRNYARNNTAFMASTASRRITERILNPGGNEPDVFFGGFAGLFVSLADSGRYSVPGAIIELARDNSKGIIRSSSGLTLREMQQKNLIGSDDYRLMLQLGMGALSNTEVIDNTMRMLNRYKLTHNSFVSGFKFFNIRLFQLLGLTGALAKKLDPFSNGMAIQRNEVYTYCCEDYKLSTNRLYFPGSYGAQQLQQMACLPHGINVFTANPMDRKEFQGYGVAPCASQETNCMLSIYNIPEKNILMATGATRHYTSTYFPSEKFEEVIINGRYAFGRTENTYIAVIGASELKYATYSGEREFERLITETYELYEGEVGPYVDSFRLTDWTRGFDLRQEGNIQFTIYEMGSGTQETFEEFVARVRSNRIEFMDNILTYVTRASDLKDEVTYVLDYAGSFTVNGNRADTRNDRYDSRFIHAGRDDRSMTVRYGEHSYSFDLAAMYLEDAPQ